jgi:hypothetical protein
MQDEVGGQGSSLLSSSVSPASAGVHAQIVYEKPLCYARTTCKRGLGHKCHIEAQRVANAVPKKDALGSFHLTAVSWLSPQPSVVG